MSGSFYEDQLAYEDTGAPGSYYADNTLYQDLGTEATLLADTQAAEAAAAASAASAAALLASTTALVANLQPKDATLTALAALDATAGVVVETGADTFIKRWVIGTANEVSVTNSSGVGGDIALSLPAAITLTGKTMTGGTFSSPALVTPALGTPASGVLTNATGLPVSTGLSGLGTSVAAALAGNVGTSGSFVVNGGALGTPSTATLTNATGLPLSTGVTGNLSVNNLNSGTAASSATFWRGDGTWAAPSTTTQASAPSGRLSASSGVAVTTADQTGVTTLYYVAIGQAYDPIYDGTNDVPRLIGTPSLTINATNNVANAQYDVYEIWDGSAFQLAAGVAWTTNTAGAGARGTGAGTAEVTTFHGRRVNANSMTMKNGGTTYTVAANQGNLIGGFRVTATAGQTEDSISKRLVWNEYNALPRTLKRVENTSSWTYSTNSFQQANASTANKVSMFSGASGRPAQAQSVGLCFNSTSTLRAVGVGVGINSTTVNSAALLASNTAGSAFVPVFAVFNDYLPLGYNEINWLENGAGADTQTWIGNLGSTMMQSGITAQTIQ